MFKRNKNKIYSTNSAQINIMSTVLSIHQLTKKFGRLLAVDHLSFEVEKGNVYGLLGPNGSGKSTTLGMILNVVNPTSGNWEWFGEPAKPEHLKRIGAIIESPKFYPYMSAYKNLEIVAQIKEIPSSKIDEKLELVGLLERKHDKYKGYSLGMKQRLAIAGALLNDPEVLILDEPTNGLDPQGIHQIRELVKTIAENGTTIILASHLLDEVEKVCSHVVVLRKGKALYTGPVDGILGDSAYVEVNAENQNKLKEVIEKTPWVSTSEFKNGNWRIYFKQDHSADFVNDYFFQNGIVLTHLVKRKASLEEQFISLTQN